MGESASFAYGPDRQRWRMVYQIGSTSESTYYLGGLMEKVADGAENGLAGDGEHSRQGRRMVPGLTYVTYDG